MRFLLTTILATTIVLSQVPVHAQAIDFRPQPIPVGAERIALHRGSFLPAPPGMSRRPVRLPTVRPSASRLPRPQPVLPPRHGEKGALIGAAVGIGLGALVGYTHPGPHLTRHEGEFWGAFGFGIFGGYIGHAFDF